ncbi:MAG: carboxypeptidase-like regulatory domain-containing protein, partial [Salinibacter sp.]
MPRAALVVIALMIGLGVAGGREAQAQASIRIRVTNAPLESALAQVRAQADLDLVYATRLVQGRTATCTYRGTSPEQALDCVLEGTDVRAERVRHRQYVLVADSSEPGTSAPRRAPLSGYVLDAETGERLPGAHVYLTELKAGATTNRDGYFVLSDLPRESYEVHVSYLGYRTVDTTLTPGGRPARIALKTAPIRSEGVVVEAGSTNGTDSARLPGMMAVALDRLDRLPSFGEPDLFRALQWTPGIRKTGIVGGGLSVRGGNPDQNLYLLDGAPV